MGMKEKLILRKSVDLDKLPLDRDCISSS